MRRAHVAFLIAVGLAASSCLKGGGFKPSSPDPTVWIDSDKHDWGKIPATDTVEHVFKVRNAGSAPLNIARVQTSCGCTAAVLDHQFLKTGEETRLKVTFDPRGRNGQQTRTLWIHSNDPKTPQKQIVIQAEIAAAAMPQAATMGAPLSATSATMSGTVATGSAVPVSTAIAPASVAPAPMTAPAAAPAAAPSTHKH